MANQTNLTRRLLFATAIIAVVCAIAASVTVRSQRDNPSSTQPTGPEPSRVLASKSRAMPPLAATGTDVKQTVLRFIDFAGNAGGDQKEEIRKALAGARGNTAAAEVMCEEAFAAQKTDHSRALLILSLLGEMKSEAGGKCLARFLKIPFPTGGTKIEGGEIIEQTALGTLQAKAVDGLAYLRTAETDNIVLDAVKSHPSIIVRAEAIEAYLWNNRDREAEARKAVGGVVRRGEQIYLDRVRRDTGESAQTFNRKLEAYLKAHPDVNPPKPEQGKAGPAKDDQPKRIPNAPKF